MQQNQGNANKGHFQALYCTLEYHGANSKSQERKTIGHNLWKELFFLLLPKIKHGKMLQIILMPMIYFLFLDIFYCQKTIHKTLKQTVWSSINQLIIQSLKALKATTTATSRPQLHVQQTCLSSSTTTALHCSYLHCYSPITHLGFFFPKYLAHLILYLSDSWILLCLQ